MSEPISRPFVRSFFLTVSRQNNSAFPMIMLASLICSFSNAFISASNRFIMAVRESTIVWRNLALRFSSTDSTS